jgi:Carboxypeptidase regulatory-like domain
MQRGIIGAGVLLLAATLAGAAPQVIGPDDRVLERASVVAEAGSFWVRDGVNLPVLLTPDGDDHLRLPNLPVARLLVLDAATGAAIPSGRLRWVESEIPDTIAEVAWSDAKGRLDLGCRGGEQVELSVVGYRPRRLILQPQTRRLSVLLEPNGDLEIVLKPEATGGLWLAAKDELSMIKPFRSAAVHHAIDETGLVVVPDLDAQTEFEGVVVAPGHAPVVGHIQGLPKRLELQLNRGLSITGRVVDEDGAPLAGARVRATGAIESLGGFRYHQPGRPDAEGRFSITGLLAGEIAVKACAPDHACTEKTLALAEDTGEEPMVFRLAPGHDLRLVIQDEYGRPAVGATVIDTTAYRKHSTDDDGVLVFEGVKPGEVFELEILGAGLRPWQGRVEADETEVVLRIPAGGVLEWPILTDRRIDEGEVMAGWTRLNHRGREVADGFAHWDAERNVIRADGLEPGPHRLEVRLPGAATLRSEVVEIGPGEEVQLAAVVPDRGLAIAGRILDGTTFQPVPGARVNCEAGSPNQFRKPQQLEHPQTTLSDADGMFLLEGLDPGRCRAVVRAPGYAGWRRDDVEPDDAGADLGDIELDSGMTITGRVVDRSDRPQAGVAVEITEDAAYAYFAETTVRTDHDGWFRAATLPVGRWVVRAGRGQQTARATVSGRRDETASVELRLGGLRLEGEILIGDRPASGGSLVLTTAGARGDGVVVMVKTDADQRRFFGIDQPPVTIAVGGDGRFAADGISSGVYTASYTPPGRGGAPVGRELIIPQTEHHRCLIRFSDAGLDGTVVDPDGLPVAGAAVLVRSTDGRPLTSGFSDGTGAFAFTGLDPGAIRIGAIHGEFGDSEAMGVNLREGDRVGPITLELKSPDGAEITLSVRSAAGSLSGAPVYLVGAETMTGFTDGQGVAGFTGVEPGRYRPCAAAYGGAAGCGPEVDLDDGDRRDLVLDLGSGGHVDVLLGPMERLPALRVMTADGIDLTSMLMMVSPPMPGPDGVRIGPLKTDDYRITVAMPEGTRQGTIGAAEGETRVLDLR